jgi:RNA polymerase sigma factor (TIGR02999 family)
MAARLMRQILVDHARRVKADRRGGQAPRVALERAFEEAALLLPPVDLLALNDALETLTKLDARKARVIELRFFGGFEVKEVAELLRVSVPTVVTDTRVARAWLLSRIDGRPSNDHRLD